MAATTVPAPGRVTFPRVLRSELLKFTSLRSTVVLLLCTVAVMVGFAALGAWGVGTMLEATGGDPAAGGPGGGDMVHTLSGTGISFAQLIAGSLGVLCIASEFTTGSARSTFAAVPARQPVFWAKAGLVAAAAFAVTFASMLLAYAVITPIGEAYGLGLSFGAETHQRMLWIGSLYVSAVVLIGFALGALLRNSAGAIVSLVALVFVLPMALSLIPADPVRNAARFTPTEVSNLLILGRDYAPDALELWQGWAALGAWVAVPLALAALVLQRRDI